MGELREECDKLQSIASRVATQAGQRITVFGHGITRSLSVLRLGIIKSDAGFHRRDRDKPFVGMQARSFDGGETWSVSETPCRLPARGTLSADEHVEERHRSTAEVSFDTPPRVDFTHPDFAIMCSRSGLRAGSYSWFYTSFDRCQRWNGPFRLPMFDYTGIAARTDYLVSSPDECLLFPHGIESGWRGGFDILCPDNRWG